MSLPACEYCGARFCQNLEYLQPEEQTAQMLVLFDACAQTSKSLTVAVKRYVEETQMESNRSPRIFVTLEPHLMEWVTRRAETQGISISGAVRDIVLLYKTAEECPHTYPMVPCPPVPGQWPMAYDYYKSLFDPGPMAGGA